MLRSPEYLAPWQKRNSYPGERMLTEMLTRDLVCIALSSRPVKENRNVADVRGIKVSDGGRERSRTSGLYSVKE